MSDQLSKFKRGSEIPEGAIIATLCKYLKEFNVDLEKPDRQVVIALDQMFRLTSLLNHGRRMAELLEEAVERIEYLEGQISIKNGFSLN